MQRENLEVKMKKRQITYRDPVNFPIEMMRGGRQRNGLFKVLKQTKNQKQANRKPTCQPRILDSVKIYLNIK
jgi:hypothetical protein